MIHLYYNDDVFLEITQALSESLQKLGYLTNIHTDLKQVPLNTRHREVFIMIGLNNLTPILPTNYIAYQFEQTGNPQSWFTPNYLNKLANAIEVWDYSIQNIQNLRSDYPQLKNQSFRYVPVGYSPCLNRIQPTPNDHKKYDILFYGSTNPRRNQIIKRLRQENFRVHYRQFDLWHDERDRLISESRIILNLHYYPRPILETTRLFYLIANSCFVISEPSLDPILDREYQNYVIFNQKDPQTEESDLEDLVRLCSYYLSHPEERLTFAQEAHQKFIENCPLSSKIPRQTLDQRLPNTPTSSPNTPSNLSTNPILNRSPNLSDSPNKNDSSSSSTQNKISETTQPAERTGVIRPPFRSAPITITAEGDALLNYHPNVNQLTADQLPEVSLVTISSNRHWALTSLAYRNFNLFDYPLKKLEWIIVDYLDQGEPDNSVIFQNDSRIKYHRLKTDLPLWEKRNYANQLATHQIICHLDDDDYYFPLSLITKVKLLLHPPNSLKSPRPQCVGSTNLGVYHLVDNYSYLTSNTIYLSEASMTYFKSFWEAQPFNNTDLEHGEGSGFLANRPEQVVTIPYYFNLIAITHKENFTQTLRTNQQPRAKSSQQNFFNLWDRSLQLFMLETRSKCLKAFLCPEPKRNF